VNHRSIVGFFILCPCLVLAQSQASDPGIILQGGTVHTISGKVIENGSVLIHNGKIVGVGQGLSAPEGYQAIDIRGQHVYPGMIDSASMVGLEKASEEQASDAQEMGLLNPQLRAASAVNTSSEAIPITRANGVTSVVEMPEGVLLSGQMSLVHLDGSNNNAMTVLPSAAIHLQFPAIVTRPIPPHDADDDDDDPAAGASAEPIPYAQAKQDYDDKMRALLAFFDNARHYRQAKLAKVRGFETDLRYEALLPVLDGATPLFVTAVREREIREAIEFADKEKIRIILADAYEAYKVLPLISSHKIPVVLGPTRTLPLNPDDPEDRSFTIPGELYKAGIKFSIATFSGTAARNLPYQAATAVPFGLPLDEAYKAVSLNAAEIFGVANRLGSIEEGKTADLIVTDGDPLDVKTRVNLMFIDGKPVNLDTHQKQLNEKYGTKK
jgi:imidazolonepropionase-like amidohydrolase